METYGEGGGGEAERRGRSELGCLLKSIESSDSEINSLPFSISTKLLGIESKCFTVLGLELAAREGWQGAAQEECVLNKTDDAFQALETMEAQVEPAPAHLAVGMWQGAMATWSLAPVLPPPPQKVSRRCTHCASEKTSKWLQGPDGPGTLCNACGQRFEKGQLLQSDSRRCQDRRSSSMENSAAGNDVAALVEALPYGVGASLDAFFDQTGSEVSWEAAGRAEEEEELEWVWNKDAFPSVETMALEVEVEEAWALETMAVEVEEEASAPDVPRARSKGRQRVTAMETTCRQANVPPLGDLRAEKGIVRRCTHCATEKTPRWRKRQGPEGPLVLCDACGAVYNRKGGLLKKETMRRCTRCATENTPQWREGPEGPRTLCNACGLGFQKKRRLLPEYLPANRPAFLTRRLKAMETTCRQASVPRAKKKETAAMAARRQRSRCTHCATESTPEWREGPEGPHTLCNACGMVFRKKGRLLPEYRPANSPAFSPLLHSNTYARALKMHRQNEAASACHGEVEGQLPPPANGPASSSPLPLRLVVSEEASGVIRATAEARRAERAAAFLAAMEDN